MGRATTDSSGRGLLDARWVPARVPATSCRGSAFAAAGKSDSISMGGERWDICHVYRDRNGGFNQLGNSDDNGNGPRMLFSRLGAVADAYALFDRRGAVSGD